MTNWEAGLKGNIQGSAAGAGIGAVAGPWGALIGGAAGGMYGGITGLMSPEGNADNSQESYQNQLRALAAGYGARSNPRASGASQAAYSSYRANQLGLIQQLEAMARGEGPSAAAIQMRQAMDRAAGAQASAASGAGGRGVNTGGALRNAMNNTAAVQAQGARDTGVMRANEQMGAINQLGTTLQGARNADEQMSQFNAQQQNQVALANLQAQLSALGINTDAQLKALIAAMGVAQPGVGTQIMGGAAQAMPGLVQWQQAQNQQAAANDANNVSSPGPVTTPGGSSLFGQYSQPDNG